MSNQRTPRAVSWKKVRTPAVLVAAAVLTTTACGSDEPDAQDLIGTWTSAEGVTWEIGEDSIQVTGGAVDEALITVTSDTIEWTDVVCGLDQVGTYEWSIVDDVLTFTLVSEDCEGRGLGLDGRTVTRVSQ